VYCGALRLNAVRLEGDDLERRDTVVSHVDSRVFDPGVVTGSEEVTLRPAVPVVVYVLVKPPGAGYDDERRNRVIPVAADPVIVEVGSPAVAAEVGVF
jgi:hypothetical protein